MATRPQDLTVVKSDVAADTIASAIWDLTNTMDVGTASDASLRRMLRKHAHELVGLHDDLDSKEIFEDQRALLSSDEHQSFTPMRIED